jgi:ribosomal protein L31E
MAKKEETPKTVLERMYNIPLRREFQKVAKWRRTEKAVSSLRSFISKHMKSDNVVLWKNGIKNPPHHLKVNASKDEKGKVIVELAELPAKAKRELEEQKKIDKKKEEKEAEKKKEEEAKKKAEEAKKAEEKKEESKKEETAKKVEKEEIKELKKELPKQQAPKQEAIQKQVEQRPSAPKQQ